MRGGDLEGKCGRCEYQRVCGGCRARAFAADGNYLGPDPSCTYEPSGRVPVVEPAGPATYGSTAQPELIWSAAAEERIKRIPSFVRGVVVKRLEDYARRRGLDEITPELMSEVRRSMPIDFSKRKPFFIRDA